MPELKAILEGRMIRMKGPLPETRLFLKAARIDEGLSRLTETRVEFISPDVALDLGRIVGQPMSVSVQTADAGWRDFAGTCVEARYLGLFRGYGLYSAEVRPWLWFLTRSRNNRIFQNLSAVEIVRAVFDGHGFADVRFRLNGSYPQRPYTVQYRETDFAFVSRLMEEEGIYWFPATEDGKDILVLADGGGSHKAIDGDATIEFNYREEDYRRRKDHIFEWTGSERVTPGIVSLIDYNFENPKADLKVSKAIPTGSHGHRSHEFYDPGGHYREAPRGEGLARVRIEAEAARAATKHALGNVRTLAAGRTFRLAEHPRAEENREYLIVSATHWLQIETEADAALDVPLPGQLDFGAGNRDGYRCEFDAVPRTVPWRSPLLTPWPEIPGLLLARVTGPRGEEIHTDRYGRIKVQFPWDRDGKDDETTTCWVRTVMPWTGKGWGMVAVPRIGQEVTIQFEDGNPDRPICTGMLYNADTMPPWGLPGNMTQSGIRTNSSKGGGGFNELMFEDKKGEELVRLQSERDFRQIVKNDAEITIGMEKKDKGDLTQTIYRHKTETLKTGDHTFKIETGSQRIEIKTDKVERIDGQSDLVVKGNRSEVVTDGDFTRTTMMGNEAIAVSMGNYSVETSLGAISMEAMQQIELKVGSSSITIDQTGITITALSVTIEGIAALEAKSPMTQVKGDAMLILKGGLTLIN
jgi:type VI secretion system secreted protein VgrG